MLALHATASSQRPLAANWVTPRLSLALEHADRQASARKVHVDTC